MEYSFGDGAAFASHFVPVGSNVSVSSLCAIHDSADITTVESLCVRKIDAVGSNMVKIKTWNILSVMEWPLRHVLCQLDPMRA